MLLYQMDGARNVSCCFLEPSPSVLQFHFVLFSYSVLVICASPFGCLEQALLLQRIPAKSTESVGLSRRVYRPMLPAWNVPSTCLPIEQELAEQCWLLLLALAGGLEEVAESVRSVALH